MSVSSPLQTPLMAEESLANGLVQDPGGSVVKVALGVSGDKPCGETTKMGEETIADEAKEATTVCDSTTTITTSTATTNNISSMPQPGVATVKWSGEGGQYLSSFQLSMNKDESSEVSVAALQCRAKGPLRLETASLKCGCQQVQREAGSTTEHPLMGTNQDKGKVAKYHPVPGGPAATGGGSPASKVCTVQELAPWVLTGANYY